jgi:hypothetical protein
MMRVNRLAFVLFSLAILFSMVREWGAPIACARTIAMREDKLKRIRSLAEFLAEDAA